MHPEIVRDVPGSCPICGMALEPITPTLDDAPNPELAEMSGRFLIGLALTIPVLLLEMGAHVLGFDLVPPRLSPWWQFAFATPVVIWAGWPFFARAAESIRNRSLNMFSLIALGTGAAWVYSVVATVAPQIFPPAFQTEHGTVAVYFEASAVIIVLVLLGQVLELRAREASGDAILARIHRKGEARGHRQPIHACARRATPTFSSSLRRKIPRAVCAVRRGSWRDPRQPLRGGCGHETSCVNLAVEKRR